MKIELESLRINQRLLQVMSSKEGGESGGKRSHILEFTCFKDGFFLYEVKFKYIGLDYNFKGTKECSLSAIGKEFEVITLFYC